MPQRKPEADEPVSEEVARELARRRAHGEGYEDGIYKRPVKAGAEDASPNALAYLIGYRRGLSARAEIVVKVKHEIVFRDEEDEQG